MFYTAVYNNKNQLISPVSQTKHVSKYLWTIKINGSQNVADIKKKKWGELLRDADFQSILLSSIIQIQEVCSETEESAF